MLLLSIAAELDVVCISALVLEGYMLRTNVVLDSLRRHDVRVSALNHLVGIDALIPRYIDWQRIVA